MKELPDEKTLLELLELAKDAEQKARELDEMGEKFAQKWEKHFQDRPRVVKQQPQTQVETELNPSLPLN